MYSEFLQELPLDEKINVLNNPRFDIGEDNRKREDVTINKKFEDIVTTINNIVAANPLIDPVNAWVCLQM